MDAEQLIMDNYQRAEQQKEKRRAEQVKFGTDCIFCGQHVFDKHEESGFEGGPDWATEDGDFGCDSSPETTEDGCGSHAASTDDEIWNAYKNLYDLRVLRGEIK